MQIVHFPGGSFAVHGLKMRGRLGHFSVWADAAGGLLDVEHFDCLRRGRSVPLNRAGLRAELEATTRRIARHNNHGEN